MDGSSGRSAQSVNDVQAILIKQLDVDVCFGMRDFLQLVLLIYQVN